MNRIGILAGLLVFLASAPVLAEKRVALVIGNGAYTNVTALDNPANDARLMERTLKELGFEVIVAIDQDQLGMKRAIIDFGRRLRSAGKDAAGLFYYAGHGVQAGGVNYLLPLQLDVRDESELEIAAVSANWILGQMENAGNAVNMLFLDSCRDNPFEDQFRSAGGAGMRGMARMDAPTGSYIGYATAPNKRAVDGLGDRNSPFTKALVRAIREPGLTVEQAFKRTRLAVMERTGNQQVPWDSSSLTGEFYFAGLGDDDNASDGGSQAVDPDALFWQSVQSSDNPASFEAYLSAYPSGKFAALARLRIEELEQVQVAAVDPTPEIADLSEDRWIDATGTVNVREGPGTSFGKAGRATGGSKLRVTGKVLGTDWYRVALANGTTGFVHGDLLTTVDPSPPPASEPEAPQTKPAQTEPASEGTQVAVGSHPSLDYAPGVKFRDCPDCPEMIVVPGGSYEMGSNDGSGNETPVHRVTISEGLAVGVFEVTQREWTTLMGGNPSRVKGNDHPVDAVSWHDAQKFIKALNRKTGQQYRLLSEAEWEYVARAGTRTKRFWGNGDNGCAYANGADLTAKSEDSFLMTSNCHDGFGGTTAPVGSFKPNPFGLHDVLGNVSEWVEDCYIGGYAGAPTNGRAWTAGDCSMRVMRGGSWSGGPYSLRSAKRDRYISGYGGDRYGFRVARIVSKS